MGLSDLEQVYNTLDLSKKGYLTAEEIQEFDQTLNFTPLCLAQVDAAVVEICGPDCNGCVRQQQFISVLQNLQHRRQLEDHVRWDFMALDNRGNNRLTIQNTLLLFQMTQGEQFSMHSWKKFLKSREFPTADVYFDEVRVWLCSIPEGEPAGENEKKDEMERINKLKEEENQHEFNKIRNYQTDEYIKIKTEEEYRNQTKRLARKKQHLWENEGIEALLHDDGKDHGEDIPSRASTNISITDIMDALKHKYTLIRTRVLQDMLQKQYGEAWLSLSDTEQLEALEQLQIEEKQLRQEGVLSEKCSNLPGAKSMLEASLDILMGDLPQDLKPAQVILKQRIANLRNEGKLEHDIEMILKNEFKKAYLAEKGDKILIDLQERFQYERDYYLEKLQSDEQHQVSHAGLTIEYARLMRQHMLAEFESRYVAAAVAVGLAERDKSSDVRLSLDRQRQEALASERLLQCKDKWFSPGVHEAVKFKSSSHTDIILAIVREITLKHQAEQQVMIEMLQGKNSKALKSSAQQSSQDGRQNRLISLRNARNSWREVKGPKNHVDHWKILQEGVCVHWAGQLSEYSTKGMSTSDMTINTSILADMQHTQDQESYTLFSSLSGKTEEDCRVILSVHQRARLDQLYDNIATIVLGTFTWSDQEKPLVDAIDSKYDMLRQLCLKHALRLEYGLGWNRLSESEKDKLLIKQRVEEKKLRQEGKILQLSDLIKLIPKEIGNTRTLLGEDRDEYNKRIVVQEQKTQEMLQNEEKVDRKLLNFDENTSGKAKPINLLADLLPRQQAEQDFLIGWLRSHDNKTANDQTQILHMVLVRCDKWLAKREDWFDVGSLAVGLFERVTGTLEGRHKADEERQKQLAEMRVKHRLSRIQTGEPYYRQTDTIRPQTGNLQGWMEALLKEMLKKHDNEREVFLNLLQDPGMEELHEAADLMNNEEQINRLSELYAKRHRLDLEKPDAQEENISILEEAAAIKVVHVRNNIKKNSRDLPIEDISTLLLVELQNEQDIETAKLVHRLANMTEEELRINREYYISCRHQVAVQHAITVLTKTAGSTQEQELIEALEEKYEAIVDKLLLEALIKQVGEADWLRMNELERQRQLIQLKIQARKLQKQGDEDGLARLLNQQKQDEELLRKLMGDNRSEFDRKLQEKLAKRRQEGLSDDGDIESEDEADDSKARNPLSALDDRFDKEKEALLAQLHGANEKLMTERERQIALIRLKREKRKAEKEGSFDEIAMLIGLSERQQCDLHDRLKNDRQRQEELAKKKIEALRKKRAANSKLQKIPEVVTDGDSSTLQDVVMVKLDEKHDNERHLLVTLLSKSPSKDTKQKLSAINEHERQEIRKHLHKRWECTKHDHVEASVSLLQEACHAKYESRRQRMLQESGEIQKDTVDVSLLADIQDLQDREAEKYLQNMKFMEVEELVVLQKKVLDEIHYQRGQCLVDLVFGPEDYGDHGENQVIVALEAKYDALREKLLLEALKKKYGEKAWGKMSNDERNRHLMEIKLQERQLRQQGHLEEAAAILGDTLGNHDLLDDLIGENRAEYDKKQKKRLETRKQRLAEGLSEKECDNLERGEAKQDGEKNILQDLDDNFEKEKQQLLKTLSEQRDRVEAERHRQIHLAQLRRDQRRAQLEDEYEAAALVIDLGRQHGAAFEESRLKQEQLARERLAAELKRRRDKVKDTVYSDCEESLDEDNSMSLIASVLEKVDIKHTRERHILMQLLQDVKVAEGVQVVEGLSDTERADRLSELRLLRTSWRELETGSPAEQMKILKEGICLRLVQLKEQLHTRGRSSSDNDLQVTLLADLQEAQDEELQQIAHDVENQAPYTLRKIRMSQMFAIKNQWHDNLVAVVLGVTMDTSDEAELIRALEDKYDAVRDKLFIEVLISEIGADKWQNLSAEEQERHLVDLKLRYKRLLRQGRQEEAEALLSGLQGRGQSVDKLQHKLGVSQEDKNRQMFEREARRDELKAERQQNDLPVDDAVLDALLDQEQLEKDAKVVKKKNFMQELDHHFEDEKAVLLKQLHDHESQLDKERIRQLELLRLRRQKKQLDLESKVDSAAILLSMAEQHERAREQSVTQELDRQRALAKERLEAIKMKRKKKIDQSELEKQLKKEQEELEADQVKYVTTRQKQGDMSLKESVLMAVERKHGKERDLLEHLIHASNDKSAIDESTRTAKNLGIEDTLDQLGKIQKDWDSWRSQTKQLATQLFDGGQLSVQDRDRHINEVSQNHMVLFRMLTQALVLKMEVEKHRLRESGTSGTELDENVLLTLISDLHQKQEAEKSATENFVVKKPSDNLEKLYIAQQMAAQEGWYDNLAAVLFSVGTKPGAKVSKVDEKAEQKHEADLFFLQDKMQNEFDQEQLELREKLQREAASGAKVDLEGELNKLIAAQDSKKKMVEETMRKQPGMEQAAHQYIADTREYERSAEDALLKMLEADDTIPVDPQPSDNLLQQKLSERSMRRRQEQQATRRQTSAGSSSSGVRSRLDHTPDMTRERTVIDVSLSDDQKNELYMQLMQQQTALNHKLESEHKRHEEQLKERLEKMKERRTSEATDLFKMAERQKTTLEKLKQGEHDRQIAATKERVARLRYEKTQTMREQGKANTRKFGEFLTEKEFSGMTEDERMQVVAKKMEENFKQEEGAVGGPDSRRKLTQEDKLQMLKERREQKKKKKHQETSENN